MSTKQDTTTMKVIKVKLYPNKRQLAKLVEFVGAARYIYNYCLDMRIHLYENGLPPMFKNDLDKEITRIKHTEEYAWLKDMPSQVLQQSVDRLDKSYQSFFRRSKLDKKSPGFPKHRSRKQPIQSITYPQHVRVNDKHSKIVLPKIGEVKMNGYRDDLHGKIKQVTVVLHNDGLITASILTDSENQVSANTNIETIGLDVGVKKFVTTSKGEKILPLDLSKDISRVKRLQQQLDRVTIGSNNRTRTKHMLTRAYRKIANKRLNYVHHIANKFLDYRIVYVEDLNIKYMTTNTVGTVDNPNKDSKRKSNLNQAITRQGWGIFFNVLDYKLSDRKSELLKVNPAYTSQKCSKCGNVDKNSRDRESYVCTKCGHSIDADVNAAINIKRIGRLSVNSPDLSKLVA